VLVTGGAGFIGSHLVDGLIRAGHRVRVLDVLLPQVHPNGRPTYLASEAELIIGDVRDADVVRRAIENMEVVVHFAAAVGVGQSMYEIRHYCDVNVLGVATLLDGLVKQRERPRRLIVASSMSIYGEGLYLCADCGPQAPDPRSREQLQRREWEPRCPLCKAAMKATGTPESKRLIPTSIYAINKRDHEEMVLTTARSLGIPAVALRFFNVYGDRQALSNPYTGVAAIFSGALLNGQRPVVFEDGLQARDFVHVSDIVEACLLAIEREDVADEPFNVGTGRPVKLLELLDLLKKEIPGAEAIEAQVLGRFREGDIRSCYADITRARERLAFEPRVRLEEGVKALAAWVRTQSYEHRSDGALAELQQHGLVR
jgi:dTDP-L-rhamnose 4-epimerase